MSEFGPQENLGFNKVHVFAMKTPRHHISEDDVTISRRNTRPNTSLNGGEDSTPIPTDLIMEIFLRLPAKSIAKCRCVSKLWASLLCLSYFTESFLTRSSARLHLLFACHNNGEVFFSSSAQPQNPDENSTHVAANPLTTFPIRGFFDIIGVVRGLVCLIDKQISKRRTKTLPVICNPSTGESLPLPPVKTRRATVRSFFGYDPVEKQFKVLSMTRGKSMAFDEHQILTLRNGKLKWKMVKCCIPHYPEYGIGICINGGLYYRATVEEVPKIISFHVRSESFSIINIDMDMALWRASILVNYKGNLGALQVLSDGFNGITGQNQCFELWVLVDVEKHEWLKHVYVLPSLWKNVVAKARLYFVGVTNTNEIVLTEGNTSGGCNVFYYNFERQTVRRVEIQGMDAFKNRKVQIFLNHAENVSLMQQIMGS